jgi:hypothetical protein
MNTIKKKIFKAFEVGVLAVALVVVYLISKRKQSEDTN